MPSDKKLVSGSEDFPLVLSTQMSLPIGFPVLADADDLQNDFQCDIQIEEIRILLYANSKFDANQNPMYELGATVRMQLDMGRMEIINDFVPIWLLGSKLQSREQTLGGFGNPGPATQTRWNYLRWKLPVPIVVPNGSTLLPKLLFQTPLGGNTVTNAANSPITAYVALVGRSLQGQLPSKLKVPFASAFIANATTGGLQSHDRQLVNKFTVPFHVQRFIGRIAASDVGSNEYWYDAEGSPGFSGGIAGQYSLTLVDSNGYYIAKDMTPWEDVFDPVRKCLNANRILEPRGWYRAQLNTAATSSTVPMIAMIGWREEELAP